MLSSARLKMFWANEISILSGAIVLQVLYSPNPWDAFQRVGALLRPTTQSFISQRQWWRIPGYSLPISVFTLLSYNTGAKPAQQHFKETSEVSAGVSQLPTLVLSFIRHLAYRWYRYIERKISPIYRHIDEN